MCGICGWSLSDRETPDMDTLTSLMLLGIEERGRHATGLAWSQDDSVWIRKEAVCASDFIMDVSFDSTPRTLIGHTRWASQGSPKNPYNNHPIVSNGLVGVHNGVLHNDDDVFAALGEETRIGEVDSEAIFAWIALSEYSEEEALSHMRGSVAVAWMDTENPDTLHLARGSSSPLVLAFTEKGSVLFASTEKCLVDSARSAGIEITSTAKVSEGTYLRVEQGNVVDARLFHVAGNGRLTATERKALNLS